MRRATEDDMNISVIVPTIASLARRTSLYAAVDSLLNQDAARILPIVVANGDRYDPELIATLKADRRIRYLYREEGNLPQAIAAGRISVDTECFGILDDDDLYLRNAAAVRLSAFHEDPSADVVVTNGFDRTNQGDTLRIDDICCMAADPALALMTFQWLPSAAAGLYRTASIGPDFFSKAPRFLEWTYVALRVALTRRIKFINTPTFVLDKRTPDSLSKSDDYLFGMPGAIAQIMSLNPPERVLRQLKRKYCAALHQVSMQALSERRLGEAWRAHMASLNSPHGLRYLSYTRHLVLGMVGVKT